MVTFDVNFILPFFFVLAIVYGGMEVSKVFSNKGVKAIIAVVIAFFASSSPEAVAIIFYILPYAAIFFIAFFFLGFILSLFKGEKKDVTLIVVALALILIFLAAQNSLEIINLQDQNFLAMIVLLVIALLLYGGYKIRSES